MLLKFEIYWMGTGQVIMKLYQFFKNHLHSVQILTFYALLHIILHIQEEPTMTDRNYHSFLFHPL